MSNLMAISITATTYSVGVPRSDLDDPVDTVIGAMLGQDVDLIPVTEGARAVGVVMMTDVFDNVSEFVLERGAK